LFESIQHGNVAVIFEEIERLATGAAVEQVPVEDIIGVNTQLKWMAMEVVGRIGS
jgi:hypothetical protein